MTRRLLAPTLAALGALLTCAPAGATTWQPGRLSLVDPGAFTTAVSCPATTLCLATDAQGGIVTSTDPAAGAQSWSRAVVDPASGGITSLACPSTALCVAVDSAGNALVSTDPAAPGSHWSTEAIDPGKTLKDISCPSIALCAVTDSQQTVLTSTTPAGGANAWVPAVLPTGDSVSCEKYMESNCASALTGLSCPSTELCVASDGVGDVFTATDPTGGVGAWTRTFDDLNDSYAGYMLGISCPSTAMCVAASTISDTGSVDATADPAGDTSRWTSYPVTFDPSWVSCPLTSLCVSDQNRLSTDPLAGGGSWRTVKIDTASPVASVSCPSAIECLAVDTSGHVVWLTVARVPVRTGAAPRVTGTPRVGRTLRASTGQWSGTRPIRFDYRWQRCDALCVPITGARSSSLRIAPSDRYWRLRVQVTASNAAGESAPAHSAKTHPVGAAGPAS